MPAIDLDEVARRPRRYWNIDGAPDLIMGLVLMAWGGISLLGQKLDSSLYWAIALPLFVLTGFAAMPLIKRLKAGVTFPRTGFVVWKAPSRGQRVATGIAAAVLAVVLVLVIRRGGVADHAGLVFGVLLGAAYVGGSVTQRAPHLLVLAAVALLLGVAFDAAHVSWRSLNWMFVALGVASVLLGAVRLAQFVRSHPRSNPGLS